MDIRIAGTVDDSIVDGPGYRYTVFTQGCPHHCPGCHNPETHPFEGGQPRTAQELLEKYHAPHCAKLVLEAAEIYEKRGILL